MTELNPRPTRTSIWDVEVRRHRIGGAMPNHKSWEVGGRIYRVGGRDRREACAEAIRAAHREAGVAAWKPYLRASVPHLGRPILITDPEAAVKAMKSKIDKQNERKARKNAQQQ